MQQMLQKVSLNGQQTPDLFFMKAVIERIGNPSAVLVIPEKDCLRLTVPSALLPEGCSEGDIVTLSIERDEAATREAYDRATRLITSLVDH